MSDTKGASGDPSMDDILASIRKIISDDEARAQGSDAASPAPPAEPGSVSASPTAAPRDDILLLTDLVDESGAPPAAARPTLVPPLAKSESPSTVKGAQPSVAQAAPGAAPPSGAAKEFTVKQPLVDHSLVEAGVAGVTASAFDRLNQAVQEAVPQPRAVDPGPSVGANGRNLEDIVKELLRPMMKDWLDKNLPTIVERFVEREIVRLTRR